MKLFFGPRCFYLKIQQAERVILNDFVGNILRIVLEPEPEIEQAERVMISPATDST
jgi:hypothetical protein